MEGVEILDKIEITTFQNWIGYGFLISSVLIVISVAIIKLLNDDFSFWTIFFCITGIISDIAVIFFTVMLFIAPQQPTGEYKYVVKVEDSVNFNEFYSKYRIISKEKYSNIYTVEERIEE